MASLHSAFQYDIFISYRQKDNKGEQWVTHFVAALKTELDTTFKEEISVYFDENPHDGLLANHDVDESLQGKLRCLIFIPILSQTYCDPKSFAWKHEFAAFKSIASADSIGLKVKLPNTNVASRILPVFIHELDLADKQLVEQELGSALRGIEFIYTAAGVVRPLKPNEADPKSNLNHTFYSDQVNKVARACKDLITGIQAMKTSQGKIGVEVPEVKPKAPKKKIGLIAAAILLLGFVSFGFYYFGGFGEKVSEPVDLSIAVLPFENMNKDPDQDYFSNGIAEDILNHLTKVSDLKVKSRTSTLQYKGTQKSITQIGDELNVGHLVEGSVRRVNDKVRIVVQLIDVKTDLHLWSETYDREIKDVLAVQSEIAIEIANALNARLTSFERQEINKEATQDVTAYDYYLRARQAVNTVSFTWKEFNQILGYINKAIKLDPTFSKAYSLRAAMWFELSSFGMSQRTWEDSVFYNATKSIEIDSMNSDGYLIQAQVYSFLGNKKLARKNFETAYRLNPKDLSVQQQYGYLLLREGDARGAEMVVQSIARGYSSKQREYFESIAGPLYVAQDYDGAIKVLKEATVLNPKYENNYSDLSVIYTIKGDYDAAVDMALQRMKINPTSQQSIDVLAWAYFRKGDYQKAAQEWSKYTEIESRFKDKTQTVPFRHRLAMTLMKLGDANKARELATEDLEIQTGMLNHTSNMGAWGGRSFVFYDLAVDNALLGNDSKAIEYLDSARRADWIGSPLFFSNDPAFAKIKDLPDFKKLQAKLDDFRAFRKRAFEDALNRANASKELKGALR